ncbi:MAG: hypothetical protein AAGA80_23780 [Cyanobacteria bacterium P01_F01_bin.143]
MTNKGNPMLGARVPSEWIEQYQELAAARGCNLADIVRTALGEYLKTQGDMTSDSDLENRVSAIEEMIGDRGDITVIINRLHLLEIQLKELQDKISNLEGKKQPSETEEKPVTETKSVIDTKHWLTTGEAYEGAQKKGITQSLGTFKRWLHDASEKEKLPTTLQGIKLEANWEIRKKGNPRDNSLRWLRFN